VISVALHNKRVAGVRQAGGRLDFGQGDGGQAQRPGGDPLDAGGDARSWRFGQLLAPHGLAVDRVEALPLGPKGFVVGEAREVEDDPRRERARPLNVGVAQQQVEPVDGRKLAVKARPERVGVATKSPPGRLAPLGESQTAQGGSVVGGAVGVRDERGDDHGGRG
jgi:hypothetical protein